MAQEPSIIVADPATRTVTVFRLGRGENGEWTLVSKAVAAYGPPMLGTGNIPEANLPPWMWWSLRAPVEVEKPADTGQRE